MKKRAIFLRRRARNRYWIKQRGKGRVRLSVFRSERHIYAQIIDDSQRKTLASASTLEKAYREHHSQRQPNLPAAEDIGRRIAQRSLSLGIDKVVFDRGGYPYHGRIKALAESARQQGLSF